MTLLGQLARDSQMAVVCTIHQPSASVYEGIDTLLLLTKGCTAYYGPSNGLVEYLGTVGKPVPVGSSLAEHALNLVNADFTSDDAVDEMIEAWRKRASPPPMPAVGLSLPVVPARASGGRLMGTLLDKISRTNLSDFSYLCGRALVYFFLGSSTRRCGGSQTPDALMPPQEHTRNPQIRAPYLPSPHNTRVPSCVELASRVHSLRSGLCAGARSASGARNHPLLSDPVHDRHGELEAETIRCTHGGGSNQIAFRLRIALPAQTSWCPPPAWLTRMSCAIEPHECPQVLFIALPTLNSTCARWPSYQREIRSGMYGPIAYWTVTSVISIVASFTLTLFAIPLLYIADDLPGSSFFKVWALLGALTLFIEASAELMAFAGQEAGTGLQGMVNMHTIQSSGAFQNPSNIIWPFRIFTYIFPGRFCFSGMLTAVFNGWDSDSDFSGAFRLPDAPVWLKESPRGLAAAANNRSFVCTGESNVCYASNGPDILRELHVRRTELSTPCPRFLCPPPTVACLVDCVPRAGRI